MFFSSYSTIDYLLQFVLLGGRAPPALHPSHHLLSATPMHQVGFRPPSQHPVSMGQTSLAPTNNGSPSNDHLPIVPPTATLDPIPSRSHHLDFHVNNPNEPKEPTNLADADMEDNPPLDPPMDPTVPFIPHQVRVLSKKASDTFFSHPSYKY
jgi:hypothetical protein